MSWFGGWESDQAGYAEQSSPPTLSQRLYKHICIELFSFLSFSLIGYVRYGHDYEYTNVPPVLSLLLFLPSECLTAFIPCSHGFLPFPTFKYVSQAPYPVC